MAPLQHELPLRDYAILIPQAVGNSWYPNSFLGDIESNQPWLRSALTLLEGLVRQCTTHAIPASRIALIGFSQGACLACEFAATYPQRYGAVLAFTGGLLGPLGTDLEHPGKLDGTPVLLSSGDPDPHVPWTRVQETAEQFTRMGAYVKLERYAGRPHTVLPAELASGAKTLSLMIEAAP
jgi:phospholipase/carboxylesterase